MKWVNSGGGPLICGEEYLARYWMGVDGLSANSAYKSDYERASRTQQYLEKIACTGGYLLVLGDEPLQSSFVRADGVDESLAIARWVYAESSEGTDSFLKRPVANVEVLAPAVSFDVIQGKMVLFDSAKPGANNISSNLEADIQPGSYLVTTEKHELEEKFNFVIHRFVKT
jgi:immunity protein 21 of polymorphic toxin system